MDPAHYHIKCFDMKQFVVKANGKPTYEEDEDGNETG